MNFGVKDVTEVFKKKYNQSNNTIFYSKIHFFFRLQANEHMTNDRRMSLKKMMQTLIAQMIFRLVFLWAQFGESWLSWYMVCMPLIFLAP